MTGRRSDAGWSEGPPGRVLLEDLDGAVGQEVEESEPARLPVEGPPVVPHPPELRTTAVAGGGRGGVEAVAWRVRGEKKTKKG